jgi:hypothetical protein
MSKNAVRVVIAFGELDPIEEVPGVQQRSKNLGYQCAITGELDERTQTAPPGARLVTMPLNSSAPFRVSYNSIDTDCWIESDGRAYDS